MAKVYLEWKMFKSAEFEEFELQNVCNNMIRNPWKLVFQPKFFAVEFTHWASAFMGIPIISHHVPIYVSKMENMKWANVFHKTQVYYSVTIYLHLSDPN